MITEPTDPSPPLPPGGETMRRDWVPGSTDRGAGAALSPRQACLSEPPMAAMFLFVSSADLRVHDNPGCRGACSGLSPLFHSCGTRGWAAARRGRAAMAVRAESLVSLPPILVPARATPDRQARARGFRSSGGALPEDRAGDITILEKPGNGWSSRGDRSGRRLGHARRDRVEPRGRNRVWPPLIAPMSGRLGGPGVRARGPARRRAARLSPRPRPDPIARDPAPFTFDPCRGGRKGDARRPKAWLASFLQTPRQTYRRAMSAPAGWRHRLSRLSLHLPGHDRPARGAQPRTAEVECRQGTAGWTGAMQRIRGAVAGAEPLMQSSEDEPSLEHRLPALRLWDLAARDAGCGAVAAWEKGETGCPRRMPACVLW